MLFSAIVVLLSSISATDPTILQPTVAVLYPCWLLRTYTTLRDSTFISPGRLPMTEAMGTIGA